MTAPAEHTTYYLACKFSLSISKGAIDLLDVALSVKADNRLKFPTSFRDGQLNITIKGTTSVTCEWSGGDDNRDFQHSSHRPLHIGDLVRILKNASPRG